MKLSEEEMHTEMQAIAQTGIENILLLTGESYQATPLSYLKQAVIIAKKYFSNIALEVHPMETEEYKELYLAGVDGITIYQETYNEKRYREVHLSGKKSDYHFRKEAPERIASAGIRHISMGILLGLHDLSEDVTALYEHLSLMEKKFPGVEYSLSFPRLKKIKGKNFASSLIDDAALVRTLSLTRTLFPRVGINLSTREDENVRDHALHFGVTKMSAGSNTSVGGYANRSPHMQDPQFDIEDNRSVKEIIRLLKHENFDPVLTDWRMIQNESI